MNTPPTLAYFYPLTTTCPERQKRAAEHGFVVPDETQMCQESTPLFEGHDQPVTYCLGDVAVKNWDDTDPYAMEKQIELATSHNVEGFIFDTFLGQINSKKVHEMGNALDKAFLGSEQSNAMKFAVMATMENARALLPLPVGFKELGRNYDPSRGTAETIIDHCAQNYWDRQNYFRIKGRPYLSMFMPLGGPLSRKDSSEMTLPDMAEYMKEYSVRQYDIDPYLVGVCLNVDDASSFLTRGVDAATGYVFLPNFRHALDAPMTVPLQNYADLLEERVQDWHTITRNIGRPFVPPVVVGWDASLRGVNNVRLEEVAGQFGYTPIVEGANSKVFSEMLRRQAKFILEHVPPDEQYVPLTAWNEVTEGNSLLPKVTSENVIDNSYLEVIRAFVQERERA